MFRKDTTAARRAGMLMAGVGLLVGMAHFVLALLQADSNSSLRHARACHGLGMVWGIATVAGALSYVVVLASPGLRARPVRAATAFATFCVGLAFVVPITLHAFAGALLFAATETDFSEWAGMTLLMTCVVHLVFAAQVGMRAAQLIRGEDAITVKRIFWTAFVTSALPWAVLLMIPPIVVAVTGLFIVPLLHAMETYAAFDRRSIEMPRARLVHA